jgi:GNAT superfamily N-acetyltransferase
LALELRRLEEDGKVGAGAVRDGRFAGRLLAALQESEIHGRHAWASLGDHGIAEGESPAIYRELYAVAGEAWVEAGYLDHYVVVPAVEEVLAAWYGLSFAQQQVYGRLALEPASLPEPESFTLRIGGPEDLDLAMELAFVIFDHQASAPTWAGAPAPSAEDARASYAEYLAKDGVAYFVAEREGEPVGHLILERVDDAETELTIAATVPAARGLGVGTALTRYALRVGLGTGLPLVHHGLALRQPPRGAFLAEHGLRADRLPALPLDHADAALAGGPGADAAEALGRDVGHSARRRIRHRRERRPRTDVRLRQLLQELGRAALGDPGAAVDDEVMAQAHLVRLFALDGEGDAGVVLDVAELLLREEMAGHDLVPVHPDPDAGHLRAPVGVERHEMCEGFRLEQGSGVRRDLRHQEAVLPRLRSRARSRARHAGATSGSVILLASLTTGVR